MRDEAKIKARILLGVALIAGVGFAVMLTPTRDWLLFEDIDLVRRMRVEGSFLIVPSPVTVSARRHVKHGIFRTVFSIYALRMGCWAGIPPLELANWYRHMGSQASLPLESPKEQRVT